MQSPVQRKVYVQSSYRGRNLPLAGESALTGQSMLNDPNHVIYAMDKKYAKEIPEDEMVNPQLVTNIDYIEIELWKYDPIVHANDGFVDVVSLALSMKDTDDERVEMQIEEVMENYAW